MQSEVNPNKSAIARLYLIIYFTMLIFGVVETVKSITLPAIKTQFGINYTETGGLISFAWFGYVALCFIVTLYLQKFGIKNSIFSGYLLIIAGCALTLLATNYFMVMIALFMVSASFGFFEVGNNALAMKIFSTKTALLMSLMHFFYGLGAVIGPYLGAYLINLPFVQASGPGGWRYVYFLLSLPIILFTLNIFFTKFEVGNNSKYDNASDLNRVSDNYTFSSVLKIPIVWIFIVMLGLMEVVEFGAANWAPFYLRDVHALNPEKEGAIFVSVFYMLFTFSRLVGGFIAEKVGYYRSLLICLIMTILLYLMGFILGLGGIWILTFTGLFIAQFWILLLSLAEKKFTVNAAIITSVIITLSGFINGLFQIIIGLTNEYIGSAWGYRSCALYAIVVLFIAVIFKSKIISPNKQEVNT